MRILLVVDALQPGNGTTASTLRFSHALRDQGHEVRLLSVGSTPVPSTRGIPVVSVPVLYLPLITHLADLQNVDLARPVRAIVSSAVAEADLVHVVMPSPLGACAKHVAQHAGVPVTSGFHIQPENITYNVHLANARCLADRIYRMLWRAFYHDVSHLHAPSEFIAEQLRRHG